MTPTYSALSILNTVRDFVTVPFIAPNVFDVHGKVAPLSHGIVTLGRSIGGHTILVYKHLWN